MELFHKGEKIPVKSRKQPEEDERRILGEAQENLSRLYQQIEEGKKTPFLFFDVDGVLIKTGQKIRLVEHIDHKDEVPLETYIKENRKEIEIFKERIAKLKNIGFKVGINTGRGLDFAKKTAALMFPENTVNTIICEGGAVILSFKKEGDQMIEQLTMPKNIDIENQHVLNSYKEKIFEFAKARGGRSEKGKSYVVTVNPPQNTPLETFFGEVKNYLEEIGISDNVEITHSATAVDITPKGTDKLKALEEVLGNDDISIYFGDAKTDEEAMKHSLINVVPGNALSSTKETAKGAGFGLVAEKDVMEGTTDALRQIETYFRFAKKIAPEKTS